MKRQFGTAVLTGILVLSGVDAQAQTETSPSPSQDTVSTISKQAVVFPVRTQVIRPKRPKPITKEFSAGVRLNTDGWSLFAERGTPRYEDTKTSDKFYNVRFWSAELSEHKHIKESRETPTNYLVPEQEKSKPFILGKVNNFYSLKLGYGNRRMIAGKPEPGTVSIHWTYSGGLALGMLKPYYVDAMVPSDLNTGTGPFVKDAIKYEENTQKYFVSKMHILGSAGWSEGLGEIKFVPGIHARTGLHFDFASSNKSKMALETGITAELYTKKLELMVRQTAFPYLISGYVSFQFGKRW